MTWSKEWPDRIWAVENASGLGHHLTQWLIGRGEAVVDIPSTATARVRELSRGGRRKNDRIDAAAAACAAFSQGDFRPVAPEGHTDVLRILDERRIDLVKQNGRLVNQLHALLRELFPGGMERDFDTEDAAGQLKSFRPETAADAMRKNVALDMVGDLRRLRFQIEDLTTRIKTELAASGTKLMKIPGVGIVTAARILARTGDPARFVNESAFANLQWHRTRRGRQRRQATAPALPRRRPHAQLGHPHRRRHPGANTQQRRLHVPPTHDGRRQDLA